MMIQETGVCGIRAGQCTISDRSGFLKSLQEIAAGHNTRLICFNADLMAGCSHAELAIRLAERAFTEGKNISNTLEMEALLFAAGSRQCNVASSFGIHEGENRVLICCCPLRAGIWTALAGLFTLSELPKDNPDDQAQKRLMQVFGISEGELEAAGGRGRLVDLVLERVALLQVLR